jgi:hypothetical protein
MLLIRFCRSLLLTTKATESSFGDLAKTMAPMKMKIPPYTTILEMTVAKAAPTMPKKIKTQRRTKTKATTAVILML